MSKFNKTERTNLDYTKTTNNCGVGAYKLDDKTTLTQQVLTTFFNENKFYGDNSQAILNTLDKLCVSEPEYVAKLCVFARCEFKLRSIAHVIASVMAFHTPSKKYVSKVIEGISLRPDDLTEIMAYYLSRYGKPIPKCLKNGIRQSLTKFSAETLSKYKSSNKSVSLKDLVLLTHPNRDVKFRQLIEGNLPVANTWEVNISLHGNKKEVWEKLIENNSLGYMAMLRNLNNIIKADPYNIELVYQRLSDRRAIANSKQLPFRFYSAYRAIKNFNHNKPISRVTNALDLAFKYSMENVDKIKGVTLIAVDVSGSMSNNISAKSEIKCRDIACTLAVIANKLCEESITVTFDTTLNRIYPDNGLKSVEHMSTCGGGTDLSLPIRYIIEKKITVDRMILLSDNECNYGFNKSARENRYWPYSNVDCEGLVKTYRKNINPNFWVHAIDLQGYGTQQFIGDKINYISGWSEKTLNFIPMVENGMDNLVETIDNYLCNYFS